MWWGPDGWGWFVGAVFMLAFWVLLVLVVVWAVRQFRPTSPPSDRRPSDALAILEERFARGEIDRQEFEERRSALRGR